MNFISRERKEALRRAYPSGCRIVLDSMEDVQAPPKGTQGTVLFVDDIGTIHPSWDNGSSLGVALGEDTCHRVASEEEVKVSLAWLENRADKPQKCPRCGELPTEDNRLLAVSRRAAVTICEHCGMMEAIEDIPKSKVKRMKLADWYIVKAGWKA